MQVQVQTLAAFYYIVVKQKVQSITEKKPPSAQPTSTKDQLIYLINCKETDICFISAEQNIELLDKRGDSFARIVESTNIRSSVNSHYYGVRIVYFIIMEGEFRKGQRVKCHSSQKRD